MELETGIYPLIIVVILTLLIAFKSKGKVRKLAWGFLFFRAWLLIFFLPLLIPLSNPMIFYFLIPFITGVGTLFYYKKSGDESYKYFTILDFLFILFIIVRALGIPVNPDPVFLYAPFIYIAILYFKNGKKRTIVKS